MISRQGTVIRVVTATLNQRREMMAAGIVTQNVNLAAKIEYFMPLLNSIRSLVPASRTGSRFESDMPTLVRQAELSVILIIAE